MKIEIWSDLICPWCGLGQHRLEQALATFSHREQVQVVHRSFQLDPRAPTTPRPVREMLTEKYGVRGAQLEAMFSRVESLAAADGLTPYHVGENIVGNTHLAHELLAFASARGHEHAAWQRLYKAYFGERRSIFEVDALVELARELGLDAEAARTALVGGDYRAQVDADAREAQSLGATGVPFVVIDRHYAIAGAQPTELFRQAIEQEWRENDTPVGVAGAEDAACGPDGCELPAADAPTR